MPPGSRRPRAHRPRPRAPRILIVQARTAPMMLHRAAAAARPFTSALRSLAGQLWERIRGGGVSVSGIWPRMDTLATAKVRTFGTASESGPLGRMAGATTQSTTGQEAAFPCWWSHPLQPAGIAVLSSITAAWDMLIAGARSGHPSASPSSSTTTKARQRVIAGQSNGDSTRAEDAAGLPQALIAGSSPVTGPSGQPVPVPNTPAAASGTVSSPGGVPGDRNEP